MKIALLTRNPKLFSHQRLMETAIARGHEIVPIDYLRCYMNITSRKPELRYLGEKLTGFDAVIPRIAASHHFKLPQNRKAIEGVGRRNPRDHRVKSRELLAEIAQLRLA